MKASLRFLSVLLALLLASVPVCFAAETPDTEYKPGLQRTEAQFGCDTAANVAKAYQIKLKSGVPLYKPKSAQPLNAYLVTHNDCQVGIDGDDMYKVSAKGLVSSITSYLRDWADAIETEADGVIRFVENPDDADLLISACQTFRYVGKYKEQGSSNRAKVYSCTVKIDAYQLSNTSHHTSMSLTNKPGKSVSAAVGTTTIWMRAPEVKDNKKLTSFVDAILKWYGMGARKGSASKLVKPVQTALVQRGYLDSKIDGKFGAKTETALKLLQKDYGLKETGKVDRATLLALYYDQESAKYVGK